MDPTIFFELCLIESLSPFQMRDHINECYPDVHVFVEPSLNSSYHILPDTTLLGYASPDAYNQAKADLWRIGRLTELPFIIKLGIVPANSTSDGDIMDALESRMPICFDARNQFFAHPQVQALYSHVSAYLCAEIKDPCVYEREFDAELFIEKYTEEISGYEMYEVKNVRDLTIPQGLEHLIDAVFYRAT